MSVLRGLSHRGAGGASPRQNKTKISPFPPGRGVGGMGAEKQTKGKVSRRQRRQAPAGRRSGWDCKCRGRLNAGDARGGAPCIRKPKISPFPTGEGGRGDGGKKALTWQKIASAARVQPRGCKGRSPLHKITLVPPFPAGRGAGGMGGGKANKRQGRQAAKKASPRRTPERHPLSFHVKHLPLPCSVSRETSPHRFT